MLSTSSELHGCKLVEIESEIFGILPKPPQPVGKVSSEIMPEIFEGFRPLCDDFDGLTEFIC